MQRLRGSKLDVLAEGRLQGRGRPALSHAIKMRRQG